jgi:predicted RNA methylase
MHYFHPTPEHIVDNIVKKHAPRKYDSVLDPSIGDGALINGIGTKNKQVTCVDIDITRLEQSKRLLQCDNIKLIHGNFLDTDFGIEKYDFIVCNPPFDGRNQVLCNKKKIPIEASFLNKCMELCSKKGRMIFILPSSVTRGSRLKWFRISILDKFNLSYSYKLPKFTFNKVEGDFSVLVFDRKLKTGKTTLRSNNTEITTRDIKKLSNVCSFDADELIALKNYKELLHINGLEIESFSQVVDLQRGDVKKDYKQDNVLHTTNCDSNFEIENEQQSDGHKLVRKGDWIIKRVSRNLGDSLMEYKGSDRKFTDCILRLRAIDSSNSYEVFFCLSVLFQLDDFKGLIIKGSGAKYLDVISLKKIGVPLGVAKAFKTQLDKFKKGTDSERVSIARQVAFKFKNAKHLKLNGVTVAPSEIYDTDVAI